MASKMSPSSSALRYLLKVPGPAKPEGIWQMKRMVMEGTPWKDHMVTFERQLDFDFDLRAGASAGVSGRGLVTRLGTLARAVYH
jgi:hypothetical protein